MARTCYLRLAFLTLTLAITVLPTWAEEPAIISRTSSEDSRPPTTSAWDNGVVSETDKLVCKVYSLAAIGDDASFCEFVVKTIPEVIEPGTWKRKSAQSNAPLLTLHPARKVLIVYHTEAVHGGVDAFLKNLRKAAPQAERSGERAVVPASFTTSSSNQSGRPASPATPAVASSPTHQPKHLFHIILEGLEVKQTDGDTPEMRLKNFTIRYEGEGIIDSTVARLVKALHRAKGTSDAASEPKDAPAVPLDSILPLPGYTPGPNSNPSANQPPSLPATDSGPSAAPNSTVPPSTGGPSTGALPTSSPRPTATPPSPGPLASPPSR